MADEQQTINRINWRAVFPFTHIFRSFRVAIHPSKLILALVGILLVYGAGRVLDLFWPGVPAGEVGQWVNTASSSAEPGKAMAEWRDSWRKRQQEELQRGVLALLSDVKDELKGKSAEDRRKVAEDWAKSGAAVGHITYFLRTQRDEEVKKAREAFDKLESKDKTKEARENLDKQIQGIYAAVDAGVKRAKDTRGEGLFITFMTCQAAQFNGIVAGVQNLSLSQTVQGLWNFVSVGPVWAFSNYPIYFCILTLIILLIYALFGGAVSRIAAMQVAREEKIGMKEALKFSFGKLLSFAFAPIIPLVIVVLLGLLLALGGLIGSIPWAGPVLMGVLFFLALALGFVITLVLLGTVGGLNLMYPTIAAEGSDSFDAISRSFSYLYAKPWQLAFYTLISVIYGAITFIFVSFFVGIMLAATHLFVGWGVFGTGINTQSLWAVMWPYTGDMIYDTRLSSLSTMQAVGGGLIAFWVYIVVGIVVAYVVSFYISSNTIIYFLMRREVDATEMDEVYVDQPEDMLPESPKADAPAAGAPAIEAKPAEAPKASDAPKADAPPASDDKPQT